MKDGVLGGKAGSRPVSEFLRSHRGLSPDEIPALTAALQRVPGEDGAKQASVPIRHRTDPSRTGGGGAAGRSGQPGMSGSTSAASCSSESCQPR